MKKLPNLNFLNCHQGVRRMEYAVRGRVVSKAMEMEKEGRVIYYCNIGNPQSLGQPPISFPRQVLSIVTNPELLNHPQLFPKDVRERAIRY